MKISDFVSPAELTGTLVSLLLEGGIEAAVAAIPAAAAIRPHLEAYVAADAAAAEALEAHKAAEAQVEAAAEAITQALAEGQG